MKQCPICDSTNIDAEFVDIGVGEQQCSPYSCGDCLSWQVGPYDEPQPDLITLHGWYINPENPYLEDLRNRTQGPALPGGGRPEGVGGSPEGPPGGEAT